VYGSPNNLALLLDRAVPILVAVAAFAGRRAVGQDLTGFATEGRPVRSADWRRVLYALALLPSLAALALTFSRGALLLGLPAAMLFVGVVRGGRALWAALVALLAAAAGLAPLLGTDRFRSLLDVGSGTGFFRLRLWQSAWAMVWDHPWLGVGPDNFLYQYRTRYILPDAWQEPNLSHPHNILLDFAARLGLGGVAILVWLQIAFWGVAWRLYRRLPEGDTRALALGLMASMAAILAHGLVDNSFFLVDLALIFFLIVGCIGRLAAVSE
jgi:O-antigen ligase